MKQNNTYLEEKDKMVEIVSTILEENFGHRNTPKSRIEAYIDLEYVKNYLHDKSV